MPLSKQQIDKAPIGFVISNNALSLKRISQNSWKVIEGHDCLKGKTFSHSRVLPSGPTNPWYGE
jgi:hypothetical protein